MGLCINIEKWDMAAAICMATEGVRAKYNPGAGGGGFGAADREIGSKLDAGKVLATVDQVGVVHEHLADWSMFAYASPNWNGTSNANRIYECIKHDWLAKCVIQDVYVTDKMYHRIATIIPIVAASIALEQSGGALTAYVRDEVLYHPSVSRSALIDELVKFDCADKQLDSESFKKKRRRYYQNHWTDYSCHIGRIKDVLIDYDRAARYLFKKVLEKQNGAI